jgi:hypothetical protein
MARMGADILVGTPSRVNHMFFGIEGNKIHGVNTLLEIDNDNHF